MNMPSLLSLPTDTLLDKFGSGSHAPGSGSAAAFIGLLAAQLVVTVGHLTLERSEYERHHVRVAEICTRIQTDLVPLLTELFQADADAFDLVIQTRRARDQESDGVGRRKLAKAALDQLKLATAIPFKIAESCIELIDHSAAVFDVGFKGARGDTGVALSAALAGVFSAVFVINLNLKSFKGSYWARQQRRECDQLQKIAISKYEAALTRIAKLRGEDLGVQSKVDDSDPIAKLWSGSKSIYSKDEIEERASAVRAIVWQQREKLWAETTIPTNPVDLLNPEVALRLLDYNFMLVETLGTFASDAGTVEVAGLLESQPGRVSVSRQMRPDIRIFTAAHELGHIVLHPTLKEAHRDRPLDGTIISRSRIEREADQFASCYLMPAVLVRKRFAAIYGADEFSLTDETAFALFATGLTDARRRTKNLRSLSLLLAGTERFDGRSYISLANQFKVSVTAMAIRLEELDLVRMEG